MGFGLAHTLLYLSPTEGEGQNIKTVTMGNFGLHLTNKNNISIQTLGKDRGNNMHNNYLTETEKLNNDVFACSLLSLTISFGSISEAGIAQLAVTLLVLIIVKDFCLFVTN